MKLHTVFSLLALLSLQTAAVFSQAGASDSISKMVIDGNEIVLEKVIDGVVALYRLAYQDEDLFETLGILSPVYETKYLYFIGNSEGTKAINGGNYKDLIPQYLKNAPEFKGTIGIVHTTSLAGGFLTSGVDFSFEDNSWNLVANDPPQAKLDVDTLINARIAYEPNNAKWQVALWGRNLTDEEYARAAAAGSFTQYAADPLTWGVDFSYSF